MAPLAEALGYQHASSDKNLPTWARRRLRLLKKTQPASATASAIQASGQALSVTSWVSRASNEAILDLKHANRY
jgi:hypothetical protein